MKYEFANRIQSVGASAIREILKATQSPDIISFSAGNPSTQSFPISSIQKISADILKNAPNVALQYSVSEGVTSFRKKILNMLEAQDKGFVKPDDSCMVLSGAQQGIDLVAKVFLNEGDTVICESPTFVSSINTFKSYGARLVGVPMEKDGMSIKELKNIISQNKNIKLLYIIPNFQNPTGYTTSLQKREQIYKLCRENNIIILEDNPYGDLLYSGDHIKSIKSLDRDSKKSNIVYIGSFSKVVAPGLRVGYLVTSNEIMEKILVSKQCNDVHTSVLPQLICEALISDTAQFNAHIQELRWMYRHKLELMCTEIDRHINGALSYEKPDGGLFLWCKVQDDISVKELCAKCLENKVAVVPGYAFSVDGNVGNQHIRLNFSTPSDGEILEGIPRLAAAIAELS